MTSSAKISGVWRGITQPYCKIAAVWKPVKAAYTRVGGVWKQWFLQGGLLDTTYMSAVGAGAGDAGILAMAIQADGKTVIGGSFTTWSGVSANGLVRLNADGSRDTTFSTNIGTGTGGTGYVADVVVHTDGTIYICGSFTSWNGVSANRVAKLNSNGTMVTSFSTNAGSAANNIAYRVAVQSTGKPIFVGIFNSFNGVTVGGIVRLNVDGTSDAAFKTNTGSGYNSYVYAVETQSDDKILVGGEGNIWNGVTRNRIVRLNSDGTLDTAFSANTGTTADAYIWRLSVDSSGNILACGQCLVWNGTTVNQIFRLTSSGTLDATFTGNIGVGGNNQTIFAAKTQPNGKVVLGGNFTTWKGVTLSCPYIVRLNSDGTLDTAFTSNLGAAVNNTPRDIINQPNSKISIGGFFTSFQGTAVGRYVRIGGDQATL